MRTRCTLGGLLAAAGALAPPALSAQEHWAFVAPQRPTPPAVRASARVRNPIDAFVLSRLEHAGIPPSPEAGRETLIRRLCLDLTGLLPGPDEVDAFVADDRPDAYQRIVERYLASPHYGERWARHWLDAARYADSSGYSIDGPRTIWKYRDWVIDAFNSDMPFDRFTIEQMAGDMLPGATDAQRTATGFHRNTMINQEGGVDKEEFRIEAVKDRTNTTSTVFLGLTMACVQCHDHKYDPFAHREYYELYAFFNDDDEVDLPTVSDQEAEKKAPKTMVLRQRAEPRDSRIHVRGDFTRKGDPVEPGVPAALHPLRAEGRATRLDLARWLVDPANPLTARVTVNRIWQRYFGRGLVETENDFGTQGAPPTHPELLDWLATELVGRGWGLKEMQRLIVSSATYRQSSRARPELTAVDPQNRLLARQMRLRLEAEIIRDAALCASGLLCDEVGGPSVFPPQPDGVMDLGQSKRAWNASRGGDRYRRGMYTWFWRATPHPSLTVFDAPSALEACTRRVRSNTPLQALTLLNDAAFFELARAFGSRVLATSPDDDAARIELAFRICMSRSPTASETETLLALLNDCRAGLRDDPAAVAKLAAHGAGTDGESAAWTLMGRVFLNLDEFITRG